jgi:hypothetical protein
MALNGADTQVAGRHVESGHRQPMSLVVGLKRSSGVGHLRYRECFPNVFPKCSHSPLASVDEAKWWVPTSRPADVELWPANVTSGQPTRGVGVSHLHWSATLLGKFPIVFPLPPLLLIPWPHHAQHPATLGT